MNRKPRTWESIYYASRRRGDDPAYSLFLADEWQKRQERKMNQAKQAAPVAVCARCEELEASIRYLAMAWDNLCDCVDEFEPSDTTACGEHRDALDAAILRCIECVDPNRGKLEL